VIVGSGLVATAMRAALESEGLCIFAAGVSNSSCTDPAEFARERRRLLAALADYCSADRFLYFSTCSVDDPSAKQSHYVRHKLEMEALVRNHPRYLVLRLPQVAGRTANPHTLLNYLYARIARSERFSLWVNSSRNFMDVEDIARITRYLVSDERAIGETINIANTQSVSMLDVVREFEYLINKPAIYDTQALGSSYAIDCSRVRQAIEKTGVDLTKNHLGRLLEKYYGKSTRTFGP
jgi:nucleoside-diphosphate-sugar epimerase